MRYIFPSYPSNLLHSSKNYPICSLLFILFITLKLCYCIENKRTDFKLNFTGKRDLFDFSENEKKALYTPYWAVEIKGGEKAARALAEKYGFLYLGEILPGIYHFKHNRLSKRSLRQNNYYHDQLAKDEQVVWLEQQVAKIRVKRDVHIPVSDPKWPQMWYLNRGGPGGLDMNVRSVWARGYTGQGVVVTILDDGLETDHPDLKDNYLCHLLGFSGENIYPSLIIVFNFFRPFNTYYLYAFLSVAPTKVGLQVAQLLGFYLDCR